jgi:hypothetical protein
MFGYIRVTHHTKNGDVIKNTGRSGNIVETTSYTDISYYIFIGKHGKVLGYTMHPTMFKKHMITNMPQETSVPAGTIGLLKVEDIRSTVDFKHDISKPDEKELVKYEVIFPKIGRIVKREMKKAPADVCPIIPIEGVKDEIQCKSCIHVDVCSDPSDETNSSILLGYSYMGGYMEHV